MSTSPLHTKSRQTTGELPEQRHTRLLRENRQLALREDMRASFREFFIALGAVVLFFAFFALFAYSTYDNIITGVPAIFSIIAGLGSFAFGCQTVMAIRVSGGIWRAMLEARQMLNSL